MGAAISRFPQRERYYTGYLFGIRKTHGRINGRITCEFKINLAGQRVAPAAIIYENNLPNGTHFPMARSLRRMGNATFRERDMLRGGKSKQTALSECYANQGIEDSTIISECGNKTVQGGKASSITAQRKLTNGGGYRNDRLMLSPLKRSASWTRVDDERRTDLPDIVSEMHVSRDIE
ncbi:hypothetical protein Trydic_g23342 [Trypoxylus dichotomus]